MARATGTAAALAVAAFACATALGAEPPPRVVLVGDSTMAPRTGYGEAFCGLFLWPVECVNLGRGGRSTKTYRADGSWEGARARMEPRGRPTWVLVQFGHNDQPHKAERATDLATEYPANLRRYVEEIRALGARPVLVTPLTRRQFTDDYRLKDDLAMWAEATRRVARETGVPLLDLHRASVEAVAAMGPTKADALAMAKAPHRDFDRTHVGPKGAALFARLLAKEVAREVPALAAAFVVGAIEPPGPVERPQMDAARAAKHTVAEVLRGWNPQEGADAHAAELVVDPAAGRDDGRSFTTVQGAIDMAAARPPSDGGRVRILVKRGVHPGLFHIPAASPPITLQGEGGDASAVVLRGTVTGAPGAAAVLTVKARDVRLRDLTVENAHNKATGDRTNHTQGVALALEDADRAHLANVRLLGFQDTFYLASRAPAEPARAFIERSYIEGDMDFIFGEGTAYFVESEIRALGDRAVSYTLAPSTHRASPFGFVFERCRFTHDGSANARAGVFKLGRQWARSPEAVGKVAILRSEIGAHIDPVRPWADWSIGTPRHRPVHYEWLSEYQNTTVGEDP